jgi:dihydropteroate synthase
MPTSSTTAEPALRAVRPELRDRVLAATPARPLLMGILNVTPDSFSDGGRYESAAAALAQARTLAAEGADIVDIGAESTRPGHTPVSEPVEWARLEAPLAAIAALDLPVTVDTTKSGIARRALSHGACVVNDIWGLQGDPEMAATVAAFEAGVVVMHNRASVDPALEILDEMRRFFDASLRIAATAGIPRHHIVLDPGIGFGKTSQQNLAALAGLDRLADYGLPILVGVSRKSLFRAVLDADVENRLVGTLAANIASVARGAAILRIHDVAPHAAALKVLQAIEGARPSPRAPVSRDE